MRGRIRKIENDQHLKHCKKRAAAIAASEGDGKAQKQRLFHLIVEGRYNPQYWMHIEMPASVSLFVLDGFLRDIWLECCGHLSAFEIAGTSYSDDRDDFSSYSIQIVGAPGQQEPKEVQYETTDEEEEEEEDLSPEELAEEVRKFLEEHRKFYDELPPEIRPNMSNELQAELSKPRSRDELVTFLKQQLASMPKESSFLTEERIRQNREEAHRLYNQHHYQQGILKMLLNMVEDRSLGVRLESVLKVGQKFSYEYDFGSTTHLNLRVASEREGVVQEDDDPVTILARNVPSNILCKVCGKPATQAVSGYFNVEENAYCNRCAKRSEEYEMLLPIVNSPRVGVCGYTG